MPKLYEYFGLIIMFYANEHEPVHVHGKFQGCESRAEIIVLNGVVSEIRYSAVVGRAPLDIKEMRYFGEIVSARADDIVAKWIDFLLYEDSKNGKSTSIYHCPESRTSLVRRGKQRCAGSGRNPKP